MTEWMYKNWPVTIWIMMVLAGVLGLLVAEAFPSNGSTFAGPCGNAQTCSFSPGGAKSAMTARSIICTCN
jgi:hypothetical protein